MINTSCKTCIFANTQDTDCLFNIPLIIKDTKNIIKKDNYNYIENYSCRYCLSQEIYNNNIEFQNTNIAQYVVEKAKIKYYLVINLANHLDKLAKVCALINGLDIKPQYISFINTTQGIVKNIADEIDSYMTNNIPWKLHNFIYDMSLQECMTIAMDTNLPLTDAKIFVVYDPNISSLDSTILNDRINFIQFESIVKQTAFHAVVQNFENIDGLALPFNAYKYLLLNSDRNILTAIQKETENNLIYITYQYDE